MEQASLPVASTSRDVMMTTDGAAENPPGSLSGPRPRASEPLDPQALQLESSWADGTYDRVLTEAQFDWPDGNYGLDTNYVWMYSAREDNWM
jgi:hypothetical protein